MQIAGALLLCAIVAGLVARLGADGWVSGAVFALLATSACQSLAGVKCPFVAFAIVFAAYHDVAYCAHELLAFPLGGIREPTWFWWNAWFPVVAVIWSVVALILGGVPVAVLSAIVRLRQARG